MHRRPLLDLLAAYDPFRLSDGAARDRIRSFVESFENCFDRSLLVGHVTGSAWILDRTRTRCLLTHHGKLDRWLQLGGHADGDSDVLAVAMREAREESGLTDIRVLAPSIFDCDVHLIPGRGTEPAHHHHDVRFLFEADADEPLVISEESKELAWVRLDEVERLAADESVLRMVARTRSGR